MTKLHDLANLGQAVWLDFIRRSFLEQGELRNLANQGLRGVTSNPTIFDQAISQSTDYDADLRTLTLAGTSVTGIYEALAIADIGRAADDLLPVYQATHGTDGFVSLEVDPNLAHNTEGTIADAARLFATLNRPNIMIKIPGTPEGLPAITATIAAGINVNVTLIFSIAQYEAVVEAYLAGLERLATVRDDLSGVASVASFFVSRVDTLLDKQLDALGHGELRGKAAIANAQLAYERFEALFAGPRWDALAAKGAQVQRPLWASTSTKDPRYPDTLYVDTLIGPHTVNTMPPATLTASLDHANVQRTIDRDYAAAHAHMAALAEAGIDLEAATAKLLKDGVASFSASFASLMQSIATRRALILAEQYPTHNRLGVLQASVDAELSGLREQQVATRIWARDYTVWKPEPTEISNRLGWLDSPEVMLPQLEALSALAHEVQAEGFTHALLLGMGGSSLAPEVFRLTFGVAPGGLDLAVVDSTDPGAVLDAERRVDLRRTLFVVSTKSGGTVETFSFFKYFYNRVLSIVGPQQAGRQFVAITDPGSGLADTAQKYQFRATFLNDPNIGGRYSGLSFFGMLPAALVGADTAQLLARANAMAAACRLDGAHLAHNPGVLLGAIIGAAAAAGRDKVTIFTSPQLASFGAWAEQLIAESTGKEGKGILPVADEPPGAPEVYGTDRLFVCVRLAGDETHAATLHALAEAGHPVVDLPLHDLYDIAAEFLRWEIATIVAGRSLGINPFDQPNVESAKILARKMVASFQQTGALPALTPLLEQDGVTVYGDVAAATPAEALRAFLSQIRPGDYVAIQAFVTPNSATTDALQALRTLIRDHYHVATTVGYGPRFLHSTGQLHKGDSGNGLFIQFTGEAPEDIAIPDEAGASASSISFGVLVAAQALGDRQALLDNTRRVIRFHFTEDVAGSVTGL